MSTVAGTMAGARRGTQCDMSPQEVGGVAITCTVFQGTKPRSGRGAQSAVANTLGTPWGHSPAPTPPTAAHTGVAPAVQ